LEKQLEVTSAFGDAQWLTGLGDAASLVMAGLDPGHPRLRIAPKKDVDARDKRGHDG
jgi:hypothetical protein